MPFRTCISPKRSPSLERIRVQLLISIYSREAEESIHSFLRLPRSVSLPSPVRWSPDGRSLVYVDTRDNISNLWSQPLDGGQPKQLTDFKSELIGDFDWSRDGRQLPLTRGTVTNDAIMISGFK
jgi:dipeptidyl aminopeptidase/acylaminoacyl peptidase